MREGQFDPLHIGGAEIIEMHHEKKLDALAGFFALGFLADNERVSFHWPLPGYLALTVLAPAVLATWPALFCFVATRCLRLAAADCLRERPRKCMPRCPS